VEASAIPNPHHLQGFCYSYLECLAAGSCGHGEVDESGLDDLPWSSISIQLLGRPGVVTILERQARSAVGKAKKRIWNGVSVL
jgi:hypothetical protein